MSKTSLNEGKKQTYSKKSTLGKNCHHIIFFFFDEKNMEVLGVFASINATEFVETSKRAV